MGVHRNETVRDAAGQGTQEFTTNEEFQDYTRKVQAVRERAAAPYVDPQSHRRPRNCCGPSMGRIGSAAATSRCATAKRVAFCRQHSGGHARMLSNETVSASARSRPTRGLASMFNNGKSPANRITADNVKVLSDGNFRVRKTVRKRSTRHPCPLTRGTRSATENFAATTRPEISWNSAESLTLGKCRWFYFGILPVIPICPHRKSEVRETQSTHAHHRIRHEDARLRSPTSQ